ncbi:MAG: hypothetical protein WC505_00800 [Patescibacteria group bacterium]
MKRTILTLLMMMVATLFIVSVSCAKTEVVTTDSTWASSPPTFASTFDTMTAVYNKTADAHAVAMTYQVSTAPMSKLDYGQYAVNSQKANEMTRPANTRAPAAMQNCMFSIDQITCGLDESRGSPNYTELGNRDEFADLTGMTMNKAPISTVLSLMTDDQGQAMYPNPFA